MKKLLFFLIVIFCFVACNNTDGIREKEEMVVYRDSFLEMQIPKSYHVESHSHWDMGNVYFVKNSDNEVVLGMHNGGLVRIGHIDRNAYSLRVLDVSCYPDFADSLACDNIVASIKAVR